MEWTEWNGMEWNGMEWNGMEWNARGTTQQKRVGQRVAKSPCATAPARPSKAPASQGAQAARRRRMSHTMRAARGRRPRSTAVKTRVAPRWRPAPPAQWKAIKLQQQPVAARWRAVAMRAWHSAEGQRLGTWWICSYGRARARWPGLAGHLSLMHWPSAGGSGHAGAGRTTVSESSGPNTHMFGIGL